MSVNRTYGGRRSAAPGARAQRGVALVVSLVLLVTMSVVGISTLASTRLNERISSNAQQKSVAFEVAESALDALRDPAEIRRLLAGPGSAHRDPGPVALPRLDDSLSSDFDQRRDDGMPSIDIDARVTVQYCGEGAPGRGTDLNADESAATMVGLLADVNGVAEVVDSRTLADHVQRVRIDGPRTGRRGRCTTPGL